MGRIDGCMLLNDRNKPKCEINPKHRGICSLIYLGYQKYSSDENKAPVNDFFLFDIVKLLMISVKLAC